VRLRQLFDRYEGRLRVMAQAEPVDTEQSMDRWVRSADNVIARFGYAVDASDCEVIETVGPQWRLGTDSESDRTRGLNRLRNCRLVPRQYARAAEREQIGRVAREIAAWCPRLFRSPHVVVEQTPDGWYVSFVPTDTTLLFKKEDIIITQPRSARDVHLGTIASWQSGERPNCSAIPTKFRKVYGFDAV
jgi:hypothetical protein